MHLKIYLINMKKEIWVRVPSKVPLKFTKMNKYLHTPHQAYKNATKIALLLQKKDTASAVAVVTGFDKWCAYQHANCSLDSEVRAKFLSILTKSVTAVSAKKSSKKPAASQTIIAEKSNFPSKKKASEKKT